MEAIPVLAAGTFWPTFFVHFSLSVGNTFGMICGVSRAWVLLLGDIFPKKTAHPDLPSVFCYKGATVEPERSR